MRRQTTHLTDRHPKNLRCGRRMGGGGASRLCNLPTYKSLMRLPDTKQPEAKSEMRSALLQYKYQAPDLSFLERNGLDNFWAFLANRIYPSWLAPNLITLCGGAGMLVATKSMCITQSQDWESKEWTQRSSPRSRVIYCRGTRVSHEL